MEKPIDEKELLKRWREKHPNATPEEVPNLSELVSDEVERRQREREQS